MLKTPLKIDCFALSDVGLVREHNEDAWGAIAEKGVFLLADGMGGHQAGEIAAKEAIAFLLKQMVSWTNMQSILDLQELFEKVNKIIYHHGQSHEGLSGMGTTLCALYIREEGVMFAHVGDSRIYRLRGGKLKALTKDHSLVNELIELGSISSHEVENFPYKHVLTKAIGTNPTVHPSLGSDSLESNDLFILCSDGLTNYVSEKAIASACSNTKPLEESGTQLVELAKKNGGGDNVTVVLAKVL